MDIYVQKDGQQQGPFSETRIRQGIDAGEFLASDLAWATGKASWQPLSSLIHLDNTKPPPLIESEVGRSSIATTAKAEIQQPPPIPHRDEPLRDQSRNRENPKSMDGASSVTGLESKPDLNESPTIQTLDTNSHEEKVLYEDAEDFDRSIWVETGLGRWMYSPGVLVTNRRLKVDDNSISLQGVQDVSLKTTLRAASIGGAVRAGFFAVGALIMICPAWALTFQHEGVRTTSDWVSFVPFLTLLWAIPIVLYFAMDRAWTRHARSKIWEAVIILSGAQGNREILIAVFQQFPVPVDRWLLLHINGIPKENVEAVLETRRERFNGNMRRIEEISKAIENALFG